VKLLRGVHPDGVVGLQRRQLAADLLSDVRRLDRDLTAIKSRIRDAVDTSNTTLLELHGVGPIVAGLILAHVGDPARFPTPERFASYNGTAPIEASSGPRKRHRLNPRGNRKLNHALHLIAVTQVRHDTPGLSRQYAWKSAGLRSARRFKNQIVFTMCPSVPPAKRRLPIPRADRTDCPKSALASADRQIWHRTFFDAVARLTACTCARRPAF
jgi:transposase